MLIISGSEFIISGSDFMLTEVSLSMLPKGDQTTTMVSSSTFSSKINYVFVKNNNFVLCLNRRCTS